MKKTTSSKSFMEFFIDPSPALQVKFQNTPEEKATTVKVTHSLGSTASPEGREYLDTFCRDIRLKEFCDFYRKHNGLELCRTHNAFQSDEKPLLDLKPIENIPEFSSRYLTGGDLDWTIDLNKSKKLYRDTDSWIAFAEVDSGPACLTTFLNGENAGCVYYVTPQPAFNILKPIAKGFDPLLDRIAKDLPSFLRLVRATVTLSGSDGENYGFVPFKYLRNTNDRK